MITRVQSNLQGGVNVQIGPKTLIVGPNESGKTTILRSIELALTGYAEDVGGRAWVKATDHLMKLAPGRVGRMWANVTMADGGQAAWEATSTREGHAPRPSHVTPPSVDRDRVLPLQALRVELTKSPERAARFLTDAACGAVTPGDVERLIPEPLRPRFWIAAGCDVATCDDALHALTTAREAATKEAGTAKATADAAASLAEAGSAGLAAPPTDAALTAAKRDVEVAMNVARETEAAVGNAPRIAALTAQIADGEATLTTLRERYGALKAERVALGEVAAPPADQQERMARGAAIVLVLGRQAASGKDTCAVCASPVDPAAMTVRANSQAVAVQGATMIMRKEAAAHAAWLRSVADIEAAQQTLRTRADLIKVQIDTAKAALAAMPATGERAATEADVQGARATLNGTIERQRAVENTATAWRQAQQQKEQAAAMRINAATWIALKEACDAAALTLVDQARAAFCLRVQQYLPPGDVFDLRLRNGDKDDVEFGLVRGGVLHSALSGAAWARVLAAMGSAMSEDGGFTVIIPEERAYDPVTLTAVLTALTSAPGQVILTSPVAPASVPAGWTVVHTGVAGADGPGAVTQAPVAPPKTGKGSRGPRKPKAAPEPAAPAPTLDLDAAAGAAAAPAVGAGEQVVMLDFGGAPVPRPDDPEAAAADGDGVYLLDN